MNIVKGLIEWLHKGKGCKTRKVSDRFFECMVRKPNPNYCEHSCCSGTGFLCNHPNRQLFAQKVTGSAMKLSDDEALATGSGS
jgi:hypothetical protein